MCDLPGNSNYAAANNRRYLVLDAFGEGGVNNVPNTLALAQVEATLALAYEQRTANLIAMQAMGVTDLTEWLPAHSEAWIERAGEIETRLGGSDHV